MKIHGIEPQTQPNNTTCVHTCIAMALGEPVEKVINWLGESPLGGLDLVKILTDCKIVWNQLVFGQLIFNGWHFACVPSLNFPGLNHQILIHFDWDSGISVIDPAIGNKYKEDGSDLRSWGELVIFIPGGKLPKQIGI